MASAVGLLCSVGICVSRWRRGESHGHVFVGSCLRTCRPGDGCLAGVMETGPSTDVHVGMSR